MPEHIPPTAIKPLSPLEGWHVLHLFFHVNHSQWSIFDESEREGSRGHKYAESWWTRSASDPDNTQLITFSMIGPEERHRLHAAAPRICTMPTVSPSSRARSSAPRRRSPPTCYRSMTELSEYTTPESEFKLRQLAQRREAGGRQRGLRSPALANGVRAWPEIQQGPPAIPTCQDRQVMCFEQHMNKRRNAGRNWYAHNFDERRQLMAGHARVGRTWHGKVRQLDHGQHRPGRRLTWGVTLFAHDHPSDQGRASSTKTRFDEVSAQYAEFGDFEHRPRAAGLMSCCGRGCWC